MSSIKKVTTTTRKETIYTFDMNDVVDGLVAIGKLPPGTVTGTLYGDSGDRFSASYQSTKYADGSVEEKVWKTEAVAGPGIKEVTVSVTHTTTRDSQE